MGIFRKLPHILILFAFSIVSLSTANASFLCICSDGHTSIENIYSSECHQFNFDHDLGDFSIEDQHDCQDSPILGDKLSSNILRFEGIEIPVKQIAAYPNLNLETASVAQNVQQLNLSSMPISSASREFVESVRLIL